MKTSVYTTNEKNTATANLALNLEEKVNEEEVAADLEAAQEAIGALSDPYRVPKTREEVEDFLAQNERLVHFLLHQNFSAFTATKFAEYDDLFQVANVGFWKGLGTYDPGMGVKLTTYCYTCACNEVRMSLRRQLAKSRNGITVPLEFGEEGNEDSHLNHEEERSDIRSAPKGVEDTVEEQDILDFLFRCIDRMPPKKRAVIKGFLSRKPQAETARELNTSQGNVSKMLKFAMCDLILASEQAGWMV